MAARQPGAVFGLLAGAVFALIGVGLVELLIASGLRPLSPLGLPGLGLLTAAALFGGYGFAGGGAVTLAYYWLNAAGPRFPEFFANAHAAVGWLGGLLLIGGLVIALRARLHAANLAALLDSTRRESETRFRHLTELSSDWYWEQDAEFRFTFVSGAERPRGIDSAEFRGRRRWDLPARNMSDDDWARHRAQLERREPFRDLQIERVDAEGRSRWAAVSGDPVFDDHGRFAGYRGVGLDITAQKEAELALRQSEERLRVIADNVPALVSYVDSAERYVFNNRVYEEWLNLPREQITGRTVRDVWGEERYRELQPNIARALRGERVTYEYTAGDPGVERHILAGYVPEFDAEGRVKGFFVLGSDITAQVAARSELRAARERLERALGGSSAALWDNDLRSGRVFLSEAWAEMLGGPPGDTLTTFAELMALVHPEDLEAGRRFAVETMKGQRPSYAFEHRVRARSGEWKWILSRGRVTERDLATGRATRMIGTNIDITDRKRLEEALQSAAHSDPLTGLANRVALMDRMDLALARARRSGGACALLYLDLDRFKQVNDSLGHAAGDALLKDFAARLRDCVRQSDTVARLGGDEFVVLLEDLKDVAAARRVAEKMLESARQPVRADGQDVRVSTSIGIALGGEETDGQAWLKRADAALYQAKHAGRDRCFVGN
jgi:diguanylate cyclase (GGDEF)-like protein/PAS domain S-box-containing protein